MNGFVYGTFFSSKLSKTNKKFDVRGGCGGSNVAAAAAVNSAVVIVEVVVVVVFVVDVVFVLLLLLLFIISIEAIDVAIVACAQLDGKIL